MAEAREPARPGGGAIAEATGAVALCVVFAAVVGATLAPQAHGEAALLGALLMAGAGLAALAGMARGYPHERFGFCNLLTLTRASLAAGLASLLAVPGGVGADPAVAWAATGAAAAALALDGLDGWAARRSGLASRFGARFDMEVDVALALVLAVLIWQGGKLGSWVLLLGAPRHLFLAAGLAAPALRAPLPPALWRKAGCAAQIGALILVLAPPLGARSAALVALGALGVVATSFGRDVVWLLRKARRHAG